MRRKRFPLVLLCSLFAIVGLKAARAASVTGPPFPAAANLAPEASYSNLPARLDASVAWAALQSRNYSAILTVGAGQTYTTIMGALTSATAQAADPGNRVLIYILNGTYSENVLLRPYVDLLGQSQSGVIIQSTSPTSGTIANTTSTNTITATAPAAGAALTVGATTNWPTNGVITIDGEDIEYSGLTSTTVTVYRRGADGTAAAGHSSAATVTFQTNFQDTIWGGGLNCLLDNLTINETSGAGTYQNYPVHLDAITDTGIRASQMVVLNCTANALGALGKSGIGLGLRGNQRAWLIDSTFTTTYSSGIYCHNTAATQPGPCGLFCVNCTGTSTSTTAGQAGLAWQNLGSAQPDRLVVIDGSYACAGTATDINITNSGGSGEEYYNLDGVAGNFGRVAAVGTKLPSPAILPRIVEDTDPLLPFLGTMFSGPLGYEINGSGAIVSHRADDRVYLAGAQAGNLGYFGTAGGNAIWMPVAAVSPFKVNFYSDGAANIQGISSSGEGVSIGTTSLTTAVQWTGTGEETEYGPAVHLKRLMGKGTALVTGDVGTLTGWGTTATVSAITGTDQAGVITISSAGTGQTNPASFVLTFHDGTWATGPAPFSIPFAVACWDASSTGTIASLAVGPAATTLTITYYALPVAGKTYVIDFMCHE